MLEKRENYQWIPNISSTIVPTIYYMLGVLLGFRGIAYFLAHSQHSETPWIYPSGSIELAIGYNVWGFFFTLASFVIISGVYLRNRTILLFGTIIASSIYIGLTLASFAAIIESGIYIVGYRSVIIHAQSSIIWGVLLYAAFISGEPHIEIKEE